jgi:YqjK-like protein
MTQTLAQRRRQMITRAAQQRVSLSQQVQDLRRPIELVDRAWAITRYFRAHPLLVALPFGLFAFRRPRMLLRWFNRGWLTKEIIRKLFIR